MRDVLLLVVIFAAAPICLFSPYFGVMMWTWIAFFSPNRFTWGFAYRFPIAMVIAVPTLVGLAITRKINPRIWTRETVTLIALWLWFAVTTFYASQAPQFAEHADGSLEQFSIVSKILFMTFVTLLVVRNRQELKNLLLLAALSFGAHAVNLAAHAVAAGGGKRLYGPRDTFIEDNNDLALAMNMMIPFLYYLKDEVDNKWVRRLLRLCFLCAIITVIFTYSRGGQMGLIAVLTLISLRSRYKIPALASLVVASVLLVSFAPASWTNRMSDLAQGNLDESAEGRLVAWGFEWNVAKAFPLTGSGFRGYTSESLYARYQPEKLPTGGKTLAPHSAYFQVIGEQGFVGFALFLFLIFGCLLRLAGLRKRAKRDPSQAWVVRYSRMLDTSFLGFIVCGAFLGRAYFDLLYFVVAAVALLKIHSRQAAPEQPVTAPPEPQRQTKEWIAVS
jgi:probable O-glycosylation ligase (exosortase A-associated)